MENPPPRWKHHLCQVRTLLCIFFDQLSLVFAALWGGLPGPVPPCLGQGCAFPSCLQEQNQVLPHPKTHRFQDTCWSFQYWARSVLQAQIYKPHNILQPWFCCHYVIFVVYSCIPSFLNVQLFQQHDGTGEGMHPKPAESTYVGATHFIIILHKGNILLA